jgi:hypothetical protein
MSTPITEVLTSLTCNISKIFSKDDFEKNLKQFEFYKINLLKTDNFFDFPQGSLPKGRTKDLSYTYLYEIFPDEAFTPIIKIMYLDSINGPLILIDTFNKNVIEQIKTRIDNSGKFIFNPQTNTFKESQSANFIYFTFYPSINLSATLISNNENLFKHPIYSYNKVLDFFS